MDWSELSHNEQVWKIPAERSKNGMPHELPLSAEAVVIIDLLAGSKEWPRKGLLFTTTGKTPISGFAKLKRRLDKTMTGHLAKRSAETCGEDIERISPWRVHDLRRTVATGLQRLGIRFEVTEAVLNHVSGSRSGVAGVYQRHNWKEEKRVALQNWAAHVASIRNA